ncbi:hypothetical protein LSTR_LSTR003670 [Laodelphax striatellus]|uniref:Uncharacterized protein n=1 Tax=Laodelphax striatellus TaxID=195883 RepID=A0A482XAS6_LAOST|nr:hypothetical protein LSTR_LSTR003670 [Laodelphax striatellus]
MDKNCESSQKAIEMATDENETSSSWVDKQDEAINHVGSPTMSVASNGSGSNKYDLEFSVGQKIEVRDYRTDMCCKS